MAPCTTQLSLPYNNTDCTTALYRIPHAHTIDPVFDTTFSTISQCLRDFQRFWYRSTQSLLLYTTVNHRYGKAISRSRGSVFTLIDTWITSKQCWSVTCLICHSSPYPTFIRIVMPVIEAQ